MEAQFCGQRPGQPFVPALANVEATKLLECRRSLAWVAATKPVISPSYHGFYSPLMGRVLQGPEGLLRPVTGYHTDAIQQRGQQQEATRQI